MDRPASDLSRSLPCTASSSTRSVQGASGPKRASQCRSEALRRRVLLTTRRWPASSNSTVSGAPRGTRSSRPVRSLAGSCSSHAQAPGEEGVRFVNRVPGWPVAADQPVEGHRWRHGPGVGSCRPRGQEPRQSRERSPAPSCWPGHRAPSAGTRRGDRSAGKTDREIKRCLKRYVARQLYRQFEPPPTP